MPVRRLLRPFVAGLIALLVSVAHADDAPSGAVLGVNVEARDAAKVPEVVPSPSAASRRPPVEGRWQPTLLPPNDLSDPPERYRNAVGGACVGMSAITHGLWASRVENATRTDIDAAAIFIRIMLPDDVLGGERRPNLPLPDKVIVDGVAQPLKSRVALVRIAEIIQHHLQPGGGTPKPPELVRKSYAEVLRYSDRIVTVSDLQRRIAAAGGRLVVGAVEFNREVTESHGHAFVLTVDAAGDVWVWDPNARMAADALGSGRLAPLKYDLVENDHFEAVHYEIELPDRTPQARRFQFLFPIETFVPRNKIPSVPGQK
jgi:hypothetical protein